MKLAAPALVPGICAGLRYVSLISAPSGHSACASCNVTRKYQPICVIAPLHHPTCFITDIGTPLHHGNSLGRNADC